MILLSKRQKTNKMILIYREIKEKNIFKKIKNMAAGDIM